MKLAARLTIVVASMLIVLGAGLVYQRWAAQRDGGREAPRLDSGIPSDGRGRIDPHTATFGDSEKGTLQIGAKLAEAGATEWKIDIEIEAAEPIDSLVVKVSRYDEGSSVDPSWTDVAWSGALQPGSKHHFEARVPLGPKPPVRVLVTGRSGGTLRRVSATAIVRPDSK